MKFSIITVCYNRADTLADTLHSVASQTWQELEHIIIDGASTDGTQDIAKQLGSEKIRLVSESDRGIYDAMNKGLRLATGDIITFLNADDTYLHCDVIANVAQHMQEKRLDALFGDVAFFRPEQPAELIRRYNSGRFTPKRIAWGWMPAHPAMFLRREVYEKTGPFRTDYRIAGDFEFIARAFWPDKLRYWHLPEVLVKMRMGGISTGGFRNTLLLNREVLRACRENNIPTNIFKILSKYPAKLLEYLRR